MKSTIYQLIFVLFFIFPYVSASVAQWCDSQNKLCVYGGLDSSKQNIEFAVFSNFNGWAAIGFGGTGNGMPDADMYIGWRNSSGGGMASYRKGTSGSPKAVTDLNGFTVIPTTVKPKSNNFKFNFSFRRPLNKGVPIQPGSQIEFIWGGSDSPPDRPDSADASIKKHTAAGKFKADFTSGKVSESTGGAILNNMDKSIVILIHGILMYLAWAIAPFVGIFIARYLKDALGVWWFKLHVLFMVGITGLFTIVGSVFMFLYSSAPHFSDTHQAIGLFVFIILIFQILLGFLSDALWSPDRTEIPWWDKLHWWTGRFVSLLAMVNCVLGILKYESIPFLAAFIATVVIGIGSLVFGQWKFGQIHHLKTEKDIGEGYNPYSLD